MAIGGIIMKAASIMYVNMPHSRFRIISTSMELFKTN
jgi:hypothetical protein